MPLDPQDNSAEDQLISDMAGFAGDPLGWVMYSFPWGEGELKDYKGPEQWQKDILSAVGSGLLTIDQAIQIAIASGHGIGKSTLVAWLILWALSTMEDTRGVVTANTKTQLETKTWAELSKWYRLFIAKHWFIKTATAIYSADPEHKETWRVDMIPWTKEKPEAFAGLHNQGKRILIIFDEASAIPDVIWETTEGALSDQNTQIIWCVFGNPTRNSGRFFESFHKHRNTWIRRQIDARTVTITNKEQIRKSIETFGIDSDYVKVRILGQFPSASSRQFISTEIADAARGRTFAQSAYINAPKILMLDNAWEGGDEIVIGLRQGLVYKILATYQKNDDDGKIAAALAKFEDQEQADAVFIDFGYGTGVYSFGKALGRNWILVKFGSGSDDPGYAQKRSEMWGKMRDWLKDGGCIPDDQVLYDDLIGPEAYPNLKGEIQLETKEDMKKRGLASPNRGDNLALSFAYPVFKKDRRGMAGQGPGQYDPLASQPQQNYNPLAQ